MCFVCAFKKGGTQPYLGDEYQSAASMMIATEKHVQASADSKDIGVVMSWKKDMVIHLFQEGREALFAIRGRTHHEGHQVHGVASKMWKHG